MAAAREDGRENDDWEMSKENVLPLREGRKVANLSAAFQPHSSLREQKQEFETELRLYNGDDPLDVWHRYLKWTVQNYPKGGRDGNLTALLERCVALFKDDKLYTNDPRYIEAWIKLSNFSCSPLEILQFMNDQGIGQYVAQFYEAWASTLEQLGSVKKADAVYQEGLTRGAEPYDYLQRKHSEFQSRVARGVMVGSDTPTHPEGQRTTLGELRGVGSHQQVGSNRRPGSSSQPGLSQQSTRQQSGPQFRVFNDENAPNPSQIPSQTGEWKILPSHAQMNRENEQPPGKWSQNRVPSKYGTVQPSDVQPKFSVHVDENDATPLATSQKLPQIDASVLSVRKNNTTVNPLDAINKPKVTNPNEIPMYPKDKVYAGADEFSLEELRAARWRAKQRLLEDQLLQAQRQQLRQQQEELLAEQEQLRQQKLRMQQEKEEMIAGCRLRLQQQQEQFDRESQRQLQEQRNHVEMEINRRIHSQMNDSNRLLNASGGQLMDTSDARHRHGPNSANDLDCGAAQQKAANASQVSPSFRLEDRNVSVREKRKHGDSLPINRLPDLNFSMPQQPAMNSKCALNESGATNRDNEALGTVQYRKNDVERDCSIMKHLSFDDVTSHNTERVTQKVKADFSIYSDQSIVEAPDLRHQKTPDMESFHDNMSACLMRSMNPTPDSQLGAASFNRSSCKSTPRSNPSPTVHTKDAMKLVMGMFSHSLDMDQFSLNDNTTPDAIPTGAPLLSDPPEGIKTSLVAHAPFTIYDETKAASSPPAKKANHVSVLDQENRPPDDGIRKSAFGDEEFEYEMKMKSDDIDDCDFTFAPSSHSTCHFNVAARMASTPLHAFGNSDPLPAPPVSSIRPADRKFGTTIQDNRDNTRSDQTIANQQQHQTFDSSKRFEPNTGLSPIIEGSSDESSKSQASSLAASHHSTGPSTSIPLAASSSLVQTAVPDTAHRTEEQQSAMDVESAAAPVDRSFHLIDASLYVPAEENACDLENSILLDPENPFDKETVLKMIGELAEPLHTFENYHSVPDSLPHISKDLAVGLGNSVYNVNESIGQGGYGKVFLVHKIDMDGEEMEEERTLVMKVEKPACPWEFYICSEVTKRLSAMNDARDMISSVMTIEVGYFYNDGSCLLSQYHNHGTLLDLVNILRSCNAMNIEPFVMFYTIELIRIVEVLHKCQIIHGDIKPDNFLILQRVPEDQTPKDLLKNHRALIKLIDFGCSIDMTKYRHGTTFTTKVTDASQCIEMKTERPWTYQIDLFGLIGTIHVLIFGQYMNVYQAAEKWQTTSKFPRNWNIDLWKGLFDSLLNVPSCSDLPDLGAIRRRLESQFAQLLPVTVKRSFRVIMTHLARYDV